MLPAALLRRPTVLGIAATGGVACLVFWPLAAEEWGHAADELGARLQATFDPDDDADFVDVRCFGAACWALDSRGRVHVARNYSAEVLLERTLAFYAVHAARRT